MKFLAVFAALVAVATSQSTWTLSQLSDAIQNPQTDPALLPYLEQALNNMMDAIYAGHSVESVTVTIPAVDLSSWSLHELSEAIQNPATDAALLPYLVEALNQMMAAIVSEEPVVVSPVTIPAMDVTSWTVAELSAALENPATNPALIPYLEHALNEVMEALMSGTQMESIAIAIPAGLVPVVEASPADVPVVPAPVEAPVVPAPAATASPLVQIIININQQEAVPVAPVAVAQPEISPEPVNVVESAPIHAEPVQVVETAPVPAEPIQVVETAPVPAEPVQVIEAAPSPVEPVQVVEVVPVASVPIGVVAPAAPAA